MNNIRTAGGLTIPDFKLFYLTILIKTEHYWYKNRHIDQWTLIENPVINAYTCGHLIFFFYKEVRNILGNKASSTNDTGQTGWLPVEEFK